MKRIAQQRSLPLALLWATLGSGCVGVDQAPVDDGAAPSGGSSSVSASSAGGTTITSSTGMGSAASSSSGASSGGAGNTSSAAGATADGGKAGGPGAANGGTSGDSGGAGGSVGLAGASSCPKTSGTPNYDGQIPMYTDGPVGPEVTMDCATDPSVGWTEYKDTFNVESPYNLPVSDRFSIDCGVYTFWVLPTDEPHEIGNDTAPRTEARWSNFTSNAPHMWSADMLVESPSDHVTVMQVHTTASGSGPVYLRVDGGAIHPLNGDVFYSGLYDKWINMKVAFDPSTLKSTVYINNCAKQTFSGPAGDMTNYFKNGVYTCSSSICKDHFKNIHLYTKS